MTKNQSVDLILTDPPYIISRDSGMDTHFNKVITIIKFIIIIHL